jgi:hypothetical protein
MESMFQDAAAFDTDIRGWAGKGLSPDATKGMFLGATAWLSKYKRVVLNGEDYDGDGELDNGPPSAWALRSTT